MNKRRFIFIVLAVVAPLFSMNKVLGQDFGDFDGFLRAGIEEAGTLMGQYLEPAVMGLSYGMSNGWYNTAKPHKSLGFDIMITANVARIPTAKEYFTFDPELFNNVSIHGTNDQIPTILGPRESVSLEYSYYDEISGSTVTGTQDISGIGMKDEIGYNIVPSPMLQVGIGTFKNTDLMIRFMPKLSFGDYSTSAFGFGIKHDIKQWIPVVRRIPMDISILAAFSGLDNRLDISDMNMQGNKQEAIFDINNWTVQALVSKKISVLTAYGGIGYTAVSSCIQMNGTYTIEDQSMPDLSVTFEDPIDISYRESSFRATAGIRLKFAFFTLHGDYTFQKYHILSAGLGVSVR